MSVLPTCIACVPLSCLVPRGRKVGYEPPCWYWELNLGLNPLLEEKPVLLPAALSLQPQISSFPIPPKRDCILAITGLHILSHQTLSTLPAPYSCLQVLGLTLGIDFPTCPGALQLLEQSTTAYSVINRRMSSHEAGSHKSIVKVQAMPCPSRGSEEDLSFSVRSP